MEHNTPAQAQALGHALAMMVAANGQVDAQELLTLEQLDAFARIGISRAHFVALADACVSEVGTQLCERSWLSAAHADYINSLLDAVPEGDPRMLVCRLAAAVITADGRVTHDERLVYDHALARWRISQASVTQAILHDRSR